MECIVCYQQYIQVMVTLPAGAVPSIPLLYCCAPLVHSLSIWNFLCQNHGRGTRQQSPVSGCPLNSFVRLYIVQWRLILLMHHCITENATQQSAVSLHYTHPHILKAHVYCSHTYVGIHTYLQCIWSRGWVGQQLLYITYCIYVHNNVCASKVYILWVEGFCSVPAPVVVSGQCGTPARELARLEVKLA